MVKLVLKMEKTSNAFITNVLKLIFFSYFRLKRINHLRNFFILYTKQLERGRGDFTSLFLNSEDLYIV